MFRRFTAFVLTMCLIPFFSACCEDDPFQETEVDFNDLVQQKEEETVKESKDSDGAYIMTVTCTGDFTIGGDNYHNKKNFYTELKAHDDDINFVMQNVRELFLADDLTLVNFEGTLTDAEFVPKSKKENSFLFNISPKYVSVLPDNGVEAVSLANNHVGDHGKEGLEDTVNALTEAGVIYANQPHMGVYDYKGILQVAMLAYNCIDRYGEGFKRHHDDGEFTEEFLQYDTFEEAVQAEIRQAKEVYPLVIVSFHWGKEPTAKNKSQGYIPTENQIRLGHLAVDAGADLVIGNHSHRIQPIECYDGKYICYSLGNFCFAGNDDPSDKTAILFQARYRIKNGNLFFKDFRIIPIRISSTDKRNDYIPTILPEGPTQDAVLNMLRDQYNIKNLDYAVTDFPLTFQ